MNPNQQAAYDRVYELSRQLHGACSALVGDARFTLVIAMPVAGDPADMAVTTCGNATLRLTRAMLERAVLQHELLRKNDEDAAPKEPRS